MDDGDVDRASDLARWLDQIEYPVDVSTALHSAREHGAPQAFLDELAKLPPDQVFESEEEAWEALGG